MMRQTNLERNCFAPFMGGAMNKIVESHTSNISSSNLNAAFLKVNEVKDIAGRTISKMADNMAKAENMAETTADLTFLSKGFKEDSQVLEKMMER